MWLNVGKEVLSRKEMLNRRERKERKGKEKELRKVLRFFSLSTQHSALRTLFSILHLSSFILVLSACQTAPPVVKIGLVAPFEGQNRPVGYDAIYSARLAVREINEQGGIGGVYVALVALDDSGDPQLAQETARSLVLDPAVVAVIGHGLPETTAAALPIYEEAQLPFISLLPSSEPLAPDFTQRYEAVTPFEETPGPYAGPTYEAMWRIFATLQQNEAETGVINRHTLHQLWPTSP